MAQIAFDYRLPLTYVRVIGARREVLDSAVATTSTSYDATVTTETGADLRTLQKVLITPEELAQQKSTWTLTSDGRLKGSDVSTTVEHGARWRPPFKLERQWQALLALRCLRLVRLAGWGWPP